MVIPVLNLPALTASCVSALKTHTSVPFEIVLIDNGSDQHTKRQLITLAKDASTEPGPSEIHPSLSPFA